MVSTRTFITKQKYEEKKRERASENNCTMNSGSRNEKQERRRKVSRDRTRSIEKNKPIE